MSEPSRRQPPVPRTPGSSRYGWFFGVLIVAIIVYITLNNATHHASQSGPAPGTRMHPFAMPLATSDLQGYADVAVRPDSGSAGKIPACRLRGPRILNSCQLSERGPVALAFFATRGGNCTDELDRLNAVRSRFPGLQVAAVSIRGDRGDVAKLVRSHRWGFPVGYDEDGIVSVLYGIVVCPATVLAYPGPGVVRETLLGDRTPEELRAHLAALIAASRRRGWTPPRS